jgi:hypothetical protein
MHTSSKLNTNPHNRTDGRFGQVVRQRAGDMSASVAITMQSEESGVISESFHGFGAGGICNPAEDRLAVLWPTVETAGGGRVFDSEVQVQVAVSGNNGGTDWAALAGATLNARLLRAPCPAGWSFSAPSRACIACFPSQYGALKPTPPSAAVVSALDLRCR